MFMLMTQCCPLSVCWVTAVVNTENSPSLSCPAVTLIKTSAYRTVSWFTKPLLLISQRKFPLQIVRIISQRSLHFSHSTWHEMWASALRSAIVCRANATLSKAWCVWPLVYFKHSVFMLNIWKNIINCCSRVRNTRLGLKLLPCYKHWTTPDDGSSSLLAEPLDTWSRTPEEKKTDTVLEDHWTLSTRRAHSSSTTVLHQTGSPWLWSAWNNA